MYTGVRDASTGNAVTTRTRSRRSIRRRGEIEDRCLADIIVYGFSVELMICQFEVVVFGSCRL